MNTHKVLCPVCEQQDRIQKVSAIHDAGLSTGSYTGVTVGVAATGSGGIGLATGQTNLAGAYQTALSKRLAPPQRPVCKQFHPFVLVLAILAIPAGLVVGLFALGLASMSSGPGPTPSNAAEVAADVLADLVCSAGPFLVAALLLGLGILTLVWAPFYNRRTRGTYDAELLRWQGAMQVWDRLYYCSRDDIVFDPDNGKQFPTSRMVHYCYRPAPAELLVADE